MKMTYSVDGCAERLLPILLSIITTTGYCADFSKIKPCLAIVSTANGVGSGFIVSIDNVNYFLTNEHVIRGGIKPHARLLDGTSVKLMGLELCRDRDLARFRVDANVHALKLHSGIPELGDPVAIYGNSDGGGVVTEILGKVIGIGPDEVETDAKFVQGNSGSPLLTEDGEVIAVATYATLYQDSSDWLKSGTRFGDVRRFALRIPTEGWVEVEYSDYKKRATTLIDAATYVDDLIAFLVHMRSDAYNKLFLHSRYNYKAFPGLFGDFMEAYNNLERQVWSQIYYDETSRDTARNRNAQYRRRLLAKDQYTARNFPYRSGDEAIQKTYAQLFERPIRVLRQNSWLTGHLESVANDLTYSIATIRDVFETSE
ncbi:MAG TPA: serine protease [Kiritimatiellia bacterium]|nr:serine protease [Kiritimatiellia bacterium]HMP00584.1 serine protease [Kiritimatiellia bacterium]